MALFFSGSIIFLQACVDDDLEFPEGGSIEVTESTALITFLNGITNETLDLNSINITYPINLSFNTGVIIEVTSNEGLLEAAVSQSKGLYINGIEFPIRLTANAQPLVIEDESDFLIAMQEFEAGTFREDLNEFFRQCFNFVFPVTMINSSMQEVILSTSGEVIDFIASETPEYQPQFQFPLELQVFSRDTEVGINSYFDFYTIFNDCGGCPDLFFNVRQENDRLYIFTADFPQINTLPSYDWFVNGEFVESDGPVNQGDNQLTETFPPGVYEVCIKAQPTDCALGTEFCQEIVVEDPCPDLFFKIEQEGNTPSYTFIADFAEKDELIYEWRLFSNGEPIASEVEQPGGDNLFFFQFAPGVYDICIFTETVECPQGAEFCKELVID